MPQFLYLIGPSAYLTRFCTLRQRRVALRAGVG